MSNKPCPGQIYVISAPSGTGKSTLTRKMIQEDPHCKLSVSYTTRSPRPHEKDGEDYFFISPDQFEDMLQKHEFIEYAKVYDQYYGTSQNQIQNACNKGFEVILDIDIQGAQQIRDQLKEAIFIFILPPSLKVLRSRLQSRGTEKNSRIELRLEKAMKEIQECKKYDYVIINDNLDKALENLKAIVSSHRNKTLRFLQNFTSKDYPIIKDIVKSD